MNKFEDFIIDKPYELTADDKEAIKKASPDEKKGEHWKDPCLDGFKKNIRTYYKKKQNECCAYCRTEIQDNQASPEIEHIIPKDLKADWMYMPFNLCLSCKLCNTKKGHTKPVLKDDSLTDLPTTSDQYLLIHPHLDKYSDNIELVDGILYKGISDKGVHTIYLCELDRYELAAARASEVLKRDADSITRFLLLVSDANNQKLLNNLDAFLEKIKGRAKRYKESQEETMN